MVALAIPGTQIDRKRKLPHRWAILTSDLKKESLRDGWIDAIGCDTQIGTHVKPCDPRDGQLFPSYIAHYGHRKVI